MKRLDRYLVSEISGPLALGLLAYTFLLLTNFLFSSAEMIIRRGVPAELVGKLLVATLPNIVVLTIPMAFLFAVLVSTGRLSGDSELTAMRSTGISYFAVLKPVLWVGAFLTLINMALTLYLLPRGNAALQELRREIIARSVAEQVEPRVFYEEWIGLIVYVFESVPGSTDPWEGVFVARTQAGLDNETSVADRGIIRADPDNPHQLVLELEDVVSHKVDFQTPDQYDTSRYDEVDQVLEDPLAELNLRRQATKGLRELTISELRQRRTDPNLPDELRNLSNVEIHKKFSIPVACLVFGLLAVPLGIQRVRGGRATGFALSILVIIVYYVLLSNGEEAARFDRMPAWLAMWLPNLVLATLGLVLLFRKNDDLPLLPKKLDLALRTRVAPLFGKLLGALRIRRADRRASRRQRARQAARRTLDSTVSMASPGSEGPSGAAPEDAANGGVVLRLPRWTMRFPNRLDRYVIRHFASTFALVLLSALAVFSVSNLTELIDEILDNNVPLEVVLDYFKYQSLQIAYEVTPISVLLTTLAVFGVLAKRNEVVAAKASGVSLYRLALPALAAALVISVLGAWVQERILPAANQRAAQLNDVIRGKKVVRTYRRGDRNWLFGQDRYIYNYLNYDGERKELHKLQVFEFDSNHRLESRLYSERARWVGDGWLFHDTWIRSFDGLETTTYQRFDRPVIVDFPESPEFFESEIRTPDTLSYPALKRYIGELESSGQAVPDLKTQLQSKVSRPATFAVMALVALPFAFRLGRKGALYGVGIGLILGMIFMATVAFCTTLGETGALPAPLAVWTPALAFVLLSLYTFLGVET